MSPINSILGFRSEEKPSHSIFSSCAQPPGSALRPMRIAVLALAVATSACVPVMAGKEKGYTTAYVAGELQASEEASLADAWRAAEGALQESALTVTTLEREDSYINVVARGPGDKKLTLGLNQGEGGKFGSKETLVKIRFGVIGDKYDSFALLDKIERNLVTGAPVLARQRPLAPLGESSDLAPAAAPASNSESPAAIVESDLPTQTYRPPNDTFKLPTGLPPQGPLPSVAVAAPPPAPALANSGAIMPRQPAPQTPPDALDRRY